MRTVRSVAVAALATVMSLALTGIVASQLAPSPASGATPTWHTAASYPPLANVSAVSCAPLSTSCVAVGDDGGHVASIIVTNNNGSTWSDASPPANVTSLSTVSCPSALVCYAAGGSGILKSSDGGSSWTVQPSTFPAQSISCFTIDECTAVGGLGIEKTSDGATWTSQTPPTGLNSLASCVLSRCITCVAVGVLNSHPSIIGTQNGGSWSLLSQPLVNLLSAISCGTLYIA